ncbi:hypothetical protein GW17_00030709 [Ensete ventricosum]|nr:hypothetical protein GW17_00030709 [Ensete ventricosum]
MEKGKASEQPGILLAELARLQELAREMEAEHGRHSPDEFSRSLLQELLVSIEKAICMAKPTTPDINPQPADGDSPRSSGESSRSETSKLAFREQMSKKRKKLPEWTREVLVSAGADPVDDGHSWRKYGQKGLPGDEASAAIGRRPVAVPCHLSWGAHLPSEEPCGTSISIGMAVAGAATAGREGARGSAAAAAEPRLAFEIRNGAQREDGRLGVGRPWPDLAFLLLRIALDDDRHLKGGGGGGGGGIQESGDTGANSASDSPAAADMDLMLQDLDFESDFSSFFS